MSIAFTSSSYAEAGAADILQRLRIITPFMEGTDDRSIRHLRDARIADVLVDAGMVPVDAAALNLPRGRRHPARSRRFSDRCPRHTAFANDKLVLAVPGHTVLRDDGAYAIGWTAIAIDHEITAILQRYELGWIAPDIC